MDNSPTQIKQAGLKGRRVALKTSNLTTALENNDFTGDIILGCFNNLKATVEAIQKRQYNKIEIIPAGIMAAQKMAAEDFHCAEIFRDSLLSNEVLQPDLNFLKNLVREKCAGKNRPPHFVEDLNLAIQSNISSSVPIVFHRSNGIFRISPHHENR